MVHFKKNSQLLQVIFTPPLSTCHMRQFKILKKTKLIHPIAHCTKNQQKNVKTQCKMVEYLKRILNNTLMMLIGGSSLSVSSFLLVNYAVQKVIQISAV